MRTIIAALHDIWHAVTERCRATIADDPLIRELRAHEKAAWRQVGHLRYQRTQRTGNVVEDTLFPPEGRGKP